MDNVERARLAWMLNDPSSAGDAPDLFLHKKRDVTNFAKTYKAESEVIPNGAVRPPEPSGAKPTGPMPAPIVAVVDDAIGYLNARFCTEKAQVDASSMRAATEDLLADITVEAAEKTLDAMVNVFPSERPELASAAMARNAVRGMETFEASRLDVADKLLRNAFDIDQNGLFLAWQSLLKTIQMTELLSSDGAADLEMVDALYRKAIEMDGENPLVQALVNQVQVLMFTDLGAANASASTRFDPNLSGRFPCLLWRARTCGRWIRKPHIN